MTQATLDDVLQHCPAWLYSNEQGFRDEGLTDADSGFHTVFSRNSQLKVGGSDYNRVIMSLPSYGLEQPLDADFYKSYQKPEPAKVSQFAGYPRISTSEKKFEFPREGPVLILHGSLDKRVMDFTDIEGFEDIRENGDFGAEPAYYAQIVSPFGRDASAKSMSSRDAQLSATLIIPDSLSKEMMHGLGSEYSYKAEDIMKKTFPEDFTSYIFKKIDFSDRVITRLDNPKI